MTQTILTYIVIGVTVAYVIYKIVKLFTTPTDNSCGCGSRGCDAKKQFTKKIKS